MGAEAWDYFVPYNPDVAAALEALRERVFASGNYNGSERKPATMAQAFEDAGADGTRSILDVTAVGDAPDFCTVCPLRDAELQRLFGTTRPTHAMVAENMEFYEDIERGQGVYIVVYDEGGRPVELFFGGYSFD